MKNKEFIIREKLLSGRGSEIARKFKTNIDLKNFVLEKTKFLDESYNDPTIQQRLWHIKHQIFCIPICQECGKIVKFSRKRGYLKTCSQICSIGSVARKNYEDCCLIKYGHKNPFASEEIKEKIVNKNMELYNVPYVMQSEVFLKKRVETYKKNYGVESPLQNMEIRNKIKQTCQKRYNCDNPSQNAKIKNKIIESYYSASAISNSHLYKKMDYILPSGKIIKIQGYEWKTLDLLLTAHSESNIITDYYQMTEIIGKIYYNYKGVDHLYFPDCYIIDSNTIIETKSTWTYQLHETINLLKKDACLHNDINYSFYIYTSKCKNLNIQNFTYK